MKLRFAFLGVVAGDGGASELPFAIGQRVEIDLPEAPNAPPIIIGRRAGIVDVRLDDPSVGQRALHVSVRDGGIWVRDLGSGSGTWIQRGDVAIRRPDERLLPGDVVGIGRLLFTADIVP